MPIIALIGFLDTTQNKHYTLFYTATALEICGVRASKKWTRSFTPIKAGMACASTSAATAMFRV